MLDIIFGNFFLFLNLSGLVESQFLKALPVLVLSFLTVKYYIKTIALKEHTQRRLRLPNVFYFLLILIGFALLRTKQPNVSLLFTLSNFITYAVFCCFTLTIYRFLFLKNYNHVYICRKLILTPFLLCACLNLIFWLLKIEGVRETRDIGDSVILSYFGLNVSRVSFAFANGINSYGTLVGGLLAVELALFFVLGKRSLISLFSIFVYALILTLTDSRLALVYPFLITLVLHLMRSLNRIKGVTFLPLLMIVGPIVFTLITQLISQISFFQSLSRSAEDLATGNGRLVMWKIATDHLLSIQPMHITGFGVFGHVASGASLIWGTLLGALSNPPEAIHPHSTVLSIVFDFGYLGLIALLYFLYISCRRISSVWATHKEISILYLSFLIYFLLMGITESFFGFYYLNAMYLCILFFLIPFCIPTKRTPN